MRISDWSSDVCSSDLRDGGSGRDRAVEQHPGMPGPWHVVIDGRKAVDRDEDRRGARDLALVQARLDARVKGIERSEERRVGKECVSKCRSRWSPYHSTKNTRQKA